MRESDDQGELQGASAGAEAEQSYKETRDLLRRLLTRKFGIPPDDVEKLLYETWFSYCMLNGSRPAARGWLIAGACSHASAYLQSRGLPVPGDATAAEVSSHFQETLRYQRATETLSPRAREALRLFQEEGMSFAEIGAELGIPEFAAERIVIKASAKVRKRLRKEC